MKESDCNVYLMKMAEVVSNGKKCYGDLHDCKGGTWQVSFVPDRGGKVQQ